MAIDYAEKIPNNVNIANDKTLQRALEHWQPSFINWSKRKRGSVQRITETLPLAVYAQLDVNLDSAVAVGILLLAISGGVLLVAKLPPLWSPSASSTPVGGW